MFYENKQLAGAQIKYTWKNLEPEKERYDFSPIEEDLKFLSSKGKKLFIQLQDVSFSPQIKNIPDYILNEPEYHGGANLQYEFKDDKDTGAKQAGWVARRWDAAVARRFHKLLAALGREFDGRIAGINLPETSVGFGSTGKYHPEGFTPVLYRDAIVNNITASRSVFQKSVVIQYANFMPGEWLPWDDKGYLASVFEHAKTIGAGVGGPDVIPFRKAQMNHSYHFAVKYRGATKLGYAVQEGNYAQLNAKTGKRLTATDIYDFAVDFLKVDFLFWFPEEPYFTTDVLPLLKERSPRP